MLVKRIFITLLSSLIFISCNNDDDLGSVNDQVNSFIYNSLDVYYLYKDEQPLFNQSFNTRNQGSPESFFETLIVENDRFSFIVDDFVELENSLAGISLTHGIDFSLKRIEEGSDDVIGFVNYVANDSPGQLAGVQRGDFFTDINGTPLTVSNFSGLINLDTFSLELLTYNVETNDYLTRDEVEIINVEFTENPILINKTINYEGLNIGYILYNQFVAGSENEFNTVIANLKAAGVDELILDLRYNGGGRVSTAVDICGMITGQFNDEILISEQWNSDRQTQFEASNPEALVSRFRENLTDGETPLNSLNLDKLYVISSKNRTASSSELVINGLSAYIDVVLIGSELGTVGKSQASSTFYDSSNFRRTGASSNHTYAVQPLIYTSANKNGTVVPNEGLIPEVFITENDQNLGVLGETSDPLLQATLDEIIGVNILSAKNLTKNTSQDLYIGNSKENSSTYQRMYD